MADIQVPMLNLSDIAQQPENVANMQLTQNQSGLVGAQTQGLNLANQKAALALGLYKRVLGDFTGQRIQGVPDNSSSGAPAAGADDNTSDDSGTAAPSAAASAQPGGSGSSDQSGENDGINSIFPEGMSPVALRNFFYVNPAGNARSQGMLLEASLTGDPGLVQYAKNQRDLQVQSDSSQSQQRAQSLYDMMTTVAGAPKGAALATLQRIEPNVAAKIEQAYPDDPADQDMAARESASHLAAVTHQWTGRALALGPDGVYRDQVTGMKVPVPVAGMSPQAYANLSAKGEALVSVPQSDGSSKQMPLWKADGAPNLAAWTATQANRGQAQLHPSVAQGVQLLTHAAQVRPGTLPPYGGAAPGAAPQPGSPPSQQQPQSAAPQSPAPPTPAQQAYRAQMQKALQDPEYRLQQPRVVAGQTATPAVIAQQQESVKARAQLATDAQKATDAASQSLVYLLAARQIMQSPDKPPTGLSAPLQSAVSRAAQAVGLTSGNWATRYQEVAKYLSNAALQNARATYGARMTQSEVGLQLNEMNPNAKMTPDAINSLIQENIRNASYTLDAAKRVPVYLRAGNDPQSFEEWNQSYFPRQRIVNQQPASTPNASGSVAPAAGPARIGSVQQYNALPKGAQYVDPNGVARIKQ